MGGPGQSQRHFLSKSRNWVFQNIQREVVWQKEFLKLMHRDKSAKMAIWQKIATLPFWHFYPCASILNFFWQNDFLNPIFEIANFLSWTQTWPFRIETLSWAEKRKKISFWWRIGIFTAHCWQFYDACQYMRAKFTLHCIMVFFYSCPINLIEKFRAKKYYPWNWTITVWQNGTWFKIG